jgi:hypothetical protein
MNFGGKLFAYGCAFYFIVAAAYGFITHDPIGTTVISLTGGLAFLIAFYVLITAKRVGPLPEDNPDAVTADADEEYGFFSPHSWWPLVIGASTSLFVVGFIFTAWLAVLGALALIYSVAGFTFEYYRGAYAQ